MDKLLLEKILRKGEMTTIEIGTMFNINVGRIAKLREKYGIETPARYKCTVCGKWKTANCFRSDMAGPCIICRVKLGWEKPHQKAGPGRSKTPNKTVQLVKRRCLKCDRQFMVQLDVNGYPLYSFCESHRKTNSYMGVEESYYGHVQTTGIRQSVLRFG